MGYTFHNAFPAEIVRLIGIVAIEGAYFDYMVGSVLARIKGGPEDIALNPDFGRDTRKKLQDIAKFQNLPDAIQKVVEASDDILRDRNFAIHGIAAYYGDETDLSTLRKADIAMRGHYVKNRVDRSADWLRELVERISGANKLMVDALEPSASLGKL
jgi:hypothetical protein